MQRSGGMVPLIPGMLSTHHSEMNKPNFRKRQILEQMSVGKALGTETALQQDTFASASKLSQVRQGSSVSDPRFSARGPLTSAPEKTGSGAARSTKYRVDATQPRWITNDRQVLRFYGYFQERALENGCEALRTRRVVLCFHLSDNALSISEPRVANSGMAQGEFMKRTVALKPNGSKFSPEDFCVGGDVRLYGRVFHLVDCDDATRTFYEEAMGTPLASPRKYPDDHSSHADEIEAIKARLRAKTASTAESKAEATRKFHENSQKVLRFFVSWHDAHPLYPETRKYVLHYYLCDDTIEVIEPKEQQRGQQQQQQQRAQMGGGGHHFAVLISRRRVARDDANQVPRLFDERPSGKQLLTDRDLRCGEWVTILSRKFLLEDCDPFTREYYLETHGVTQESCELQPASARHKPSKWTLFQTKETGGATESRAGLGQPGFSAAMLQRLEAHVQDNQELRKKASANGGQMPLTADNSLDKKQLRFRAKFHGLSKSDLNFGREFTLTYFLEDDTLCVFEPRVKNSGVTGGRFLDRGRFHKCLDAGSGDTKSREGQKERSTYCASDFFVGAIVRFEFSPNQRLELLEADEQTLSYCESHPELFPFSNCKLILEALTKALLGSKSAELLRRECHNSDRRGSRVLTMDEFCRVLEKLRLAALLNTQQLLTLTRKFSKSADGAEPIATNSSSRSESRLAIAYDEFCDAIASQVVSLDPSAALSSSRDTCLRKLTKVPNLRALLRSGDASNGNVCPGDVFLRIVSFYHVGLSANDLEALMSRFSRNGAVEYHKLCDAVFQLSPSASAAGVASARSATECSSRQRPSHRQQDDEADDDEFNFNGDDLDQCVFGSRKYQLRKALRERDVDKTGQLGEEEFMDAVLSIEPKLSDDDTYAIADAYFPTNNCQLDYSQLLESAFRT